MLKGSSLLCRIIFLWLHTLHTNKIPYQLHLYALLFACLCAEFNMSSQDPRGILGMELKLTFATTRRSINQEEFCISSFNVCSNFYAYTLQQSYEETFRAL